MLSYPWGRGRNSCTSGEGTDQINQPLEGGNRRVLKRRPKTPCVTGAALSQFGHPGTAEHHPCTAGQVPAARGAKPSCGCRVSPGVAKAAAGCFVQGLQRQVASEQGNHLCFVPSWMFLLALVGTCYCFVIKTKIAIRRVVRERLSRDKTEAKCLFGHYHSWQKLL